MSTHRSAFTRSRTFYSPRRGGYVRAPMVRRYYKRAQKPTQVSLFQDTKSSPEYKNLDVPTIGLAMAAGVWQVQTLSTLTVGTAATNILGRKGVWKSISMRYLSNAGGVRIMIVYDKQCNAAAPVPADILSGTDVTAHQALYNNQRFIILSDKIYTSAQEGSDSAAPDLGVFCKDFRRMSLDFTVGPAGGIPLTGGIFMLINSPNAARTISFTTRLRFVDN